MNGYKAFYASKTADIYAEDMFKAKQQAIAHFKVPKSKQHMVSVVLCEKEGQQVTHTPDF